MRRGEHYGQMGERGNSQRERGKEEEGERKETDGGRRDERQELRTVALSNFALMNWQRPSSNLACREPSRYVEMVSSSDVASFRARGTDSVAVRGETPQCNNSSSHTLSSRLGLRSMNHLNVFLPRADTCCNCFFLHCTNNFTWLSRFLSARHASRACTYKDDKWDGWLQDLSEMPRRCY